MNPRRLASLFFVAGLASASAQTADPGHLKPRELFYTPPPASPPPHVSPRPKSRPQAPKASTHPEVPIVQAVSQPLVLRYSVLRRSAGKQFEEVSPDAELHTGDAVKLRVAVNEASYLYVIAKGTSGGWGVVFPRPDKNESDNLVQRGKTYDIPRQRPWVLEEPSGVERLYVLVTKTPDPEMDRFIRTAYPKSGESTSPSDNGVQQEQVDRLQQLAQARDLVFEKGDEPDSTNRQDQAVYIMTKATDKSAAIAANITLKH